jgi:hypothetical protein
MSQQLSPLFPSYLWKFERCVASAWLPSGWPSWLTTTWPSCAHTAHAIRVRQPSLQNKLLKPFQHSSVFEHVFIKCRLYKWHHCGRKWCVSLFYFISNVSSKVQAQARTFNNTNTSEASIFQWHACCNKCTVCATNSNLESHCFTTSLYTKSAYLTLQRLFFLRFCKSLALLLTFFRRQNVYAELTTGLLVTTPYKIKNYSFLQFVKT